MNIINCNSLLTYYTVLGLFVLYRQFDNSNFKRTPYSFEFGIVRDTNCLSYICMEFDKQR